MINISTKECDFEITLVQENAQYSCEYMLYIQGPNPSLFIFLLINDYIFLIEIMNLIWKNLLSLNCQ